MEPENLTEELEAPITGLDNIDLNFNSSNDFEIMSLLPIVLIIGAIVLGFFGLKFNSNLKDMAKVQKVKRKDHLKNQEEVQEELEVITKQTDKIEKTIPILEKKAKEVEVEKINKVIENTVTELDKIEEKRSNETIVKTNDRLNDHLKKIRNRNRN